MYRSTACVLLLCIGTLANDLRFDYEVSEGKARFAQDVETNLGKNVVTYHTPAHNDVLESYKMQDFKEGKQITCIPSLNQCRLRDIDRTTAADAGKVTESFVHSWNDGVNSISSENSKVITELYYIDGDEIKDTVFLGHDLRRFYEKFEFPLYKEKKIPKDAEMLPISQSGGKRQKRSFTPLSNDCKGRDRKRVYGVDTGRTCNYLKICKDIVKRNGQHVFADCGNVHITSPLAYVCVCCEWVQVINPRGNECSCTKMGN